MKAAMARHSSGVVRMSVTLALWRWKRRAREAVGDGLGRPEVHHVERAGGADPGEAGAGDGAEPVGAGGEDAADDVVGDLGGGGVDHALEHAAAGEHLQRAAAGAGGVEDERVVGGAELSATRVTQGVVTPNMLRPTAGLVVVAGRTPAMAVMAAAAWARTVRVMRLRPARSATGCIMVMSETPT